MSSTTATSERLVSAFALRQAHSTRPEALSPEEVSAIAGDYGVGENLVRALEAWAVDHIPPGGFLQACLANNLAEAALRADATNKGCLDGLVRLMANELPSPAWGSAINTWAWCDPDHRGQLMEYARVATVRASQLRLDIRGPLAGIPHQCQYANNDQHELLVRVFYQGNRVFALEIPQW